MTDRDPLVRVFTRVCAALIVCLATLSGGCAGKNFQPPVELDVNLLRERAISAVEDNIRVSAAVPGRVESSEIFGIDLSEQHIQPVWLEIENNSDRVVYFLQTGLDPEYFSPGEVVFAFRGSLSDDGKNRLGKHIEGLSFRDPIDPRSTVSGFVFTNSDRETKFVTVDLLSREWSTHLTLMVPIPDRLLSDSHVEKVLAMISEADPVHVEDESRLRTLLEHLPCCAADENGVQSDPLNVVLIGGLGATGPALLRRKYHYAPASPLYLFGRPQDLALKKGDRWIAAQPHVLRVWLTNIRYHGKIVWIGQISTPLGGRFAGAPGDESVAITDPDVDEARFDFIQDAIYSQMVSEFGLVKGVGPVASASPRTTPGGSTYHTDGLRAVMIFDREPTSLSAIEFLSWERLVDHIHQ